MGLHLPDAVRLHATERGTSAALTCDGRTVGYAELDSRSNRIARALLAETPPARESGSSPVPATRPARSWSVPPRRDW